MATTSKPNILMIMSDDVGIWNVSAYHRGMMGGRTPNIDRVAREGALFTDYYGQQSCTAGRAAFILGMALHIQREAIAPELTIVRDRASKHIAALATNPHNIARRSVEHAHRVRCLCSFRSC